MTDSVTPLETLKHHAIQWTSKYGYDNEMATAHRTAHNLANAAGLLLVKLYQSGQNVEEMAAVRKALREFKGGVW